MKKKALGGDLCLFSSGGYSPYPSGHSHERVPLLSKHIPLLFLSSSKVHGEPVSNMSAWCLWLPGVLCPLLVHSWTLEISLKNRYIRLTSWRAPHSPCVLQYSCMQESSFLGFQANWLPQDLSSLIGSKKLQLCSLSSIFLFSGWEHGSSPLSTS